MKTLKPHQESALRHLSTRVQGALLMEMRLGKNLAVIRHLAAKGIVHTRVLFVTQFGAMQGIEDDLNDEGITVTVLTGTREKRLKGLARAREKGGWVIVNYESAERLELHKEEWKVVILDETIKIANPKSTLTKYFLSSAWKKFHFRFILNGKVNPESIFQICCQFLFLHGTYMGCKNYWAYRARYFIQTSEWEWIPKQGHKQAVYDYVRKNAFVLLRKDANIGPDKIYEKRRIPATPQQKAAMKYLAKHYELGGVEYKNDLGVQIGQSYLAGGMMPDSTHEILSFKKLEELLYLAGEIEDKILVWCRFRAEVLLVSKFLTANGIQNITITGADNKEQRLIVKRDFDQSENVNVAVLTIASCAKGQDWSTADTSIYYSNEWSNDLRGQSEDRLIHVEKTCPVLIIDLITEGSVDEDVVQGLRTKNFDSNLIMGKFLSKYSKQPLPEEQ